MTATDAGRPVALDPVEGSGVLYERSIRVWVDGQEIPRDRVNGYIYDALTHSIRFHGTAKQQAFAAKIDIAYDLQTIRIKYLDSGELMYAERKGQRMIHRNYLAWIQNLVNDMNRNLTLMQS